MATGDDGLEEVGLRFTTEGAEQFRRDIERANQALTATSTKMETVRKSAFAMGSGMDASSTSAKTVKKIADAVEESLEALGIPLDGAAQSVKKLAGVFADFGGAGTAVAVGLGASLAAVGALGVGMVALQRDARDLADSLRAFREVGFAVSTEDAAAIERANIALDSMGIAIDALEARMAGSFGERVANTITRLTAMGEAAARALPTSWAEAATGSIGVLSRATAEYDDSLRDVVGTQEILIEQNDRKNSQDADSTALGRELAEQEKTRAEAAKKAEEAAKAAAAAAKAAAEAVRQAREAANQSLTDYIFTIEQKLLPAEEAVWSAFDRQMAQIERWAAAGAEAELVTRAQADAVADMQRQLEALIPTWSAALPSLADLDATSVALADVAGGVDEINASLEEAVTAVGAEALRQQLEAAAAGAMDLGSAVAGFYAELQSQTTQSILDSAEVGADGVARLNNEQKHALLDSFRKEKAAAIATAGIQALQAAAMTLASIPFPASLVPAAAVGIEFATLIASIEAQKPPTFHRGLSPDEFPATLQAGEAVLTRQGVQSVGGAEAITAANRGTSPATGSRSTTVDFTYAGRAIGRVLSDGLRRPGEIRDILRPGSTPGRSGILAPVLDNSGV